MAINKPITLKAEDIPPSNASCTLGVSKSPTADCLKQVNIYLKNAPNIIKLRIILKGKYGIALLNTTNTAITAIDLGLNGYLKLSFKRLQNGLSTPERLTLDN